MNELFLYYVQGMLEYAPLAAAFATIVAGLITVIQFWGKLRPAQKSQSLDFLQTARATFASDQLMSQFIQNVEKANFIKTLIGRSISPGTADALMGLYNRRTLTIRQLRSLSEYAEVKSGVLHISFGGLRKVGAFAAFYFALFLLLVAWVSVVISVFVFPQNWNLFRLSLENALFYAVMGFLMLWINLDLIVTNRLLQEKLVDKEIPLASLDEDIRRVEQSQSPLSQTELNNQPSLQDTPVRRRRRFAVTFSFQG